MKATGIVRRIDELGRVVIPKEIRRTLRIREGDPLEIFTENDGGIILKKYSPIGELSAYATEFVSVLHSQFGVNAAICDKDHIIACAGSKRREHAEKRISEELEETIAQRRTLMQTQVQGHVMRLTAEGDERNDWYAVLVVPIIAQGDTIGAVILYARDDTTLIGTAEVKTAEAIAAFLGKQMEQ